MFSHDLTKRQRVGFLTTLGDLKTLNADIPQLWENAGAGSFVFGDNKMFMGVTAGQYCVRRSKMYYPYFSGKSQLVEGTFTDFAPQDGVIKRFGYFSSNAVAPYDSTLDGFFLQSDTVDGVTFQTWRAGTLMQKVKQANWFNDPMLNYNWDNFTFCAIDFLWLGGLGVRLFFKYGDDIVLAHQFNYASDSNGYFIKSPHQTVRYELRSTGGQGVFTARCAHVSTEGSFDESGRACGVTSPVAGTPYITCATIGTKYALLGVRKKTGFRDAAVKLIDFSALVGTTNDQILLTIEKNPTFAGGSPIYADVPNEAALQSAVGNGAITVTASTARFYPVLLSQNNILPSNLAREEYLSWLGALIDDTSETLWLCGQPLTATVQLAVSLSLKLF